MKCCVFGGGGFIGSHIVERLVVEGHDVRVFERVDSLNPNLLFLGNRIERVQGNYQSPDDVAAAVKGADVIYHLISTTLPGNSNSDMVYDITSNLVPFLHILDAAVRYGVGKVIYASSGGTVYGIPQQVPIPEDHSTQPTTSYGIHKLTAEKYLDLYHRLHGLDYAVMRISNPYGERQKPTGSQGAVTVFLYKALVGEQIEIWGDGSVVRDYLYVTDVADAALRLLDTNSKEKVFNIGSGEGLSLNQLLQEIEQVVERPVSVRYTEGRAIDVPVSVLDTTRICKATGWKPTINLATGLKRTARYLQAHRI